MRSESKICVVTLLVKSKILDLLGAPRACVDFRDSTEVSRLMPKFPEPPDEATLRQFSPEIEIITTGTTVARIFSMGGNYATTWDAFRYFGPTASRFDHHLPDAKGKSHMQQRGIMYLARGKESIPTCLAEVFQTARVIDRYSHNPCLAGFKLASPITLLNLRGTFSTTIGASSAIHSGQRSRARRWAQKLYAAYPNIDGIYYCSSMYGNEPAIALFERGLQAIPKRPLFHRELKDPALTSILTATARKITYKLV